MKRHLFSIICLSGVAVCFYFSASVDRQADNYRKEGVDKGDLALRMGKYAIADPLNPDREPLFQADPGVLAKKPENKKLLQEADDLLRTAQLMRWLSQVLWYGGFVLLGLLAIAQVRLMLRPHTPEADQVPDMGNPAYIAPGEKS